MYIYTEGRDPFPGLDESDFIRELVHCELARLSFLSENERKALGVTAQEVR